MILTAIFMLLFIACDAAQDAITHNFEKSIFRNLNPKFFNPDVSWINKYKDDNPLEGPKFFGSTTFLVWLTDFWHLLKFVKMNCIWIALAVSTYWWIYPLGMLLHGVFFEVFYRLFKKQ